MKNLVLSLFLLATSPFFSQEKNQKSEKKASEVGKDSLASKSNSLSEVTVYGNKKEHLKIEGDKTIVSVKGNPILSTGTALEAIKKLPGVVTSPVGGLSLNGKNIQIQIDGSPSTLTGVDLQNYLSSLPAHAIEKAELTYNPGAAYDAAATGSVINLVTTTQRMKGINASFNLNYNFNNYQKPSPQLMLNGKTKSFSWQTMLGMSYIESFNRVANKQTFTYFIPERKLQQNNPRYDIDRNWFIRTGTNFKISANANLLLNYNGSFSKNQFDFTNAVSGDVPLFLSQGATKYKENNHELSLQYKVKLDTLGRTLDVVTFTNLFDKNPTTNSNASANAFNNSLNNLQLQNYYLKYDFVIPFNSLGINLSTGGKHNTIKVKNYGDYFSNTNPFQSINFDYDEKNLAFYGEIQKQFKKLTLTAGVRFEDFRVKRLANNQVNPIYFKNSNFFPNASASYQITDKISISSSFSKKIEQPGYSSIDPNSNNENFNQYNTAVGNFNLKPVFFDNYELKVTAFDYVQLGANYVICKDPNRFMYKADDNQLVSNQTLQAFEKIKTFNAFASFPIPIDYFTKNKEEFTKRVANMDTMNYLFASINYNKFMPVGFVLPFENKPVVSYYLQSHFILPWGITNMMSYYIQPKGGNFEIYRITKTLQQFDISFEKDFMKKKLKIGLHAFDLFNSLEVNALIAGKNLITDYYQKADSRVFRVSITYNFGNLDLEKEDSTINVEKIKSGGLTM